MDSLYEMFPTLSPGVIQSTYSKVGCSVEDAIEELLKISDNESEQVVGQGVGHNPALHTTSHTNAQNWHQQPYGQTGSYLSHGWGGGAVPPPYSATPGSQYSYGYNQPYSGGFSDHQGLADYGHYYSGGNSTYGYGGQHTWASEVSSARQETAAGGSSLLDTPSSSGGSSVASSPSHAPQGVTNVSYSQALHTSPKGSPFSSPRPKPSPLHQSRASKPKKRLIIMRGLPGSGKSTLARKLKGKTGVICSTDDFFIQNGQYVYDPSKLGENHDKNKKKVQEAMEAGTTPVIVDNTNLSSREMEPYVSLAEQYGYSTEFREPDTWWRKKPHELARRNSHGVPEFKIRHMMERFEKRVTVESVLASQTSFPSSGSGHESKKVDVSSKPALLPSLQVQPQQQQQQHQEQQQSSVLRGTTLSVINTDPQPQHSEEESKDADSMKLLKLIHGSTTATPSTVEDYSRQDQSSFNLTVGQQSFRSEPVDLCRFSNNSAQVSANLGESPKSVDGDCRETQSGVTSSLDGSQMPVFGTSSAPSDEQYFVLQDRLEYRDPEPLSTVDSAADATLSDLSLELSQNEPPILLVSSEHQEHIPPPLEDDSMGEQSPSVLWSTRSTASQDSSKVSNVDTIRHANPSLAGLKLDVEREENDDAITPPVVGDSMGIGGLVFGLTDMTLTNTQAPRVELGEDVLMESVTTGPASTAVQSRSSEVLEFLRDCFPEQSEDFLMHCWECSHGDIDACMDLVLTASFKDDEEGETSSQYSAEDDVGAMSQLPVPKSAEEIKLAAPPSRQSSSTSGTSSLGAPLAEEGIQHSAPPPLALTDEEYARQLQAEYDKETESPSQSATVPQPTVEQPVAKEPKRRQQTKEKDAEKHDDEYLVAQYGQDEGFVLRLPRLLAYKLQDLYGSVSQHTEGDDLSNEDLAVLLSEQVAKSLYNLWVKTLQAKQEEIAVQKDLQRQRTQDTSTATGRHQEAPSSSPVHTRSPSKKQSQRKRRKKKYVPLDTSSSGKHSSGPQQTVPRQGAKSAREPSLMEIMDEQQAQEMGAEQYSATVDEWLEKDRAVRLQVNNLYRRHSNVPKDVIDRYLVQTGMDIYAVDSHLRALSESSTVSVFKKSQNPKPAGGTKDKPDPYDSYSSRPTPSDDYSDSSVYQEYDNPTYHDYRAEAQLQAQLRHEAFQKAAAAWRSNRKDLASYYAAQGRKHSEQMKDANHRAAWHIYEKRNSYRRNSIDLHGLHVTEALSILEKELSLAKGSKIEIITGQGSHSHGGVPRLKKAVLNHLNTKGLPYDIPSHNPGAIIVDLSWKGRR